MLLEEKSLCDQLALDKLWDTLGSCLGELSQNNDQNAVLILQPAVETFFLVHAGLYFNSDPCFLLLFHEWLKNDTFCVSNRRKISVDGINLSSSNASYGIP